MGSWERRLATLGQLKFLLKSGPAGLFEDEMWIGRGGEMCAL